MTPQDADKENKPSGGNPSLKRTLTISTAIMVGSVFLSRVIGLVREQVLAVYGGTHFEIDAYVTSFFLPEILNHLLAGGFLSVTFIPIYQRYLVRKDEQGGSACFSNLLTVGTVLFALVIPLTVYFTPEILGLMGSHIADPQHKAVTVRLTRIILPAQLFFYWGAFLSAVQMAHQRFFLPALAPLIYNLGIILGGLLLGPFIGVEGFAWGVLAGALAGNFILQIPGAARTGIKFTLRFNLTDPDLVKYVVLSVPLVLGLGLTFSNEVFFRFFGSFLGEGGTASLNYALRVMMMVVAVFGQASGVAFFPFISRLAAEKKFGEMTSLLNTVLTKIILYLLPLSAIMIVLSREIIGTLFQYGKFDAAATAATAPVLSVYLLGAFGFSAVMIINRSFYAMQNTLLPMVVSTVTALLTLPLYWIFAGELGASGIALAAVFCMTAQFLVLYLMWLRKFRERTSTVRLVRMFLKALGIAAVGAGCCWGVKVLTAAATAGWGTLVGNLMVLAASSLIALGVVFFLYEVLGIQNFKESVKALIRR
jgi:putative peptidoglycan lipid II flippase